MHINMLIAPIQHIIIFLFHMAIVPILLNQAIHHGSNTEEVGAILLDGITITITIIRITITTSWTDVGKLYEFITQYYVWTRGRRDARQINIMHYRKYMQFEWPNDISPEWDHSVIIVQKGSGGYRYPIGWPGIVMMWMIIHWIILYMKAGDSFVSKELTVITMCTAQLV